MGVSVFQFNGCDKCFNNTLLLKDIDVERINNPKDWKPSALDVAVITGYLTEEDKPILEEIKNNAKKVIGYGSCPTLGGIFGLLYQKGQKIIGLEKEMPDVTKVYGCLAGIEDLSAAIKNDSLVKKGKLCSACKRTSTCDYLEEVNRQIDPNEDTEACFNDLGFMCNGYVAYECSEKCVDFGAPCRGCNPFVDKSGFRMLGMFGTLLGNIEVATEATGKGGTDKLADRDDDVTAAVPDTVGQFFRFDLPTEPLPIGRIPSTGSIYGDVLVGRQLEELPSLLGMMGGSKSVSYVLDALEAYEKALASTDNAINVSDKVKAKREELRKAEEKLQAAQKSNNSGEYEDAVTLIRKIAGNMNLSNLYFGGFRVPPEGVSDDEFDELKASIIPFVAGTYKSENLAYTVDENGIITEFKLEGK